MNINDIKTWPPGAIMLFDNREQVKKQFKSDSRVKPHVGFGIVLANDGEGTIWVIWDSNCRDMFTEYFVKSLNTLVISRVG